MKLDNASRKERYSKGPVSKSGGGGDGVGVLKERGRMGWGVWG